MDILCLDVIAKAVKKYRIDNNLNQDDLEDDNISRSTISKIERSDPNVSGEKIDYLLSKLEIDKEELLKTDVSDDLEYKNLLYKSLESVIDCGGSNELVDSFIKQSPSPYPKDYFLRGKYYYHQEEWQQSIEYFSEAIRLSNQEEEETSNIEAAAFNEISRCWCNLNDIQKALLYVEQGLECFRDDDPNYQWVKYSLFLNKATYLNKLEHTEAALQSTLETWEYIPLIDDLNIILNLYVLRVNLLLKMKMFNEAIQYCKEGIETARKNDQHDMLFLLWSNLGNIYFELKKEAAAEICYTTAKSFEPSVSDERLLITTFTRLGKLYIKQKRWHEADDILTRAIEIGEQVNDVVRLIPALITSGDLYRNLNNAENAETLYNRAMELSRKYGHLVMERDVATKLAETFEHANKEKFLFYTVQVFRLQRKIND